MECVVSLVLLVSHRSVMMIVMSRPSVTEKALSFGEGTSYRRARRCPAAGGYDHSCAAKLLSIVAVLHHFTKETPARSLPSPVDDF